EGGRSCLWYRDDRSALERSERPRAAVSDGVLPLAIFEQEERTPARRAGELPPLIERLIIRVVDVRDEACAHVLQQPEKLRADVIRRLLDLPQPRELLAIVELDRRQPGQVHEHGLLHVHPVLTQKGAEAVVDSFLGR